MDESAVVIWQISQSEKGEYPSDAESLPNYLMISLYLGTKFHRVGSATEKDIDPIIVVNLGMQRRLELDDLVSHLENY